MTARSRKWLKYTFGLLVFAALGLPFIPAGLFRARIQNALELGLGRKVEIGAVHFTLLPSVLPGPGFTIDQVLIHEDDRAGIEPFAYVDSLGASVRLSSLFKSRLEFSSLNLGDATINIVKSDAGPWNFQFLLAGAAGNPRAMPSIRMRGGRVNFKFGDTKSVFYFKDADLDVQPSPDGAFELRLGGAPSRTNRTAQEFGRLFVSGTSSAQHQLDFTVDLEHGELEEILRWVAPDAHGLHGTVKLAAQVVGPSSNLAVKGRIEIGDIHHWDMLPDKDSAFPLDFTGKLDIPGEHVELVTASSQARPAVNVRFQAARWLSVPAWSAAAEIDEVPLGTLLKIARHMGAEIPQEVAAEGTVGASLVYREPEGLSGRVELSDATLAFAGVPAEVASVRATSAVVVLTKGVAKLEKTIVHASGIQTAEVEGSYAFAHASDPVRDTFVRIATRGLDAAAVHSFAQAIPVTAITTKGTWLGQIRYRAQDPGTQHPGTQHPGTQHPGTQQWSGDLQLRDGLVELDGLAQPLEIASAAVTVNGPKIAITKVRARAGDMPFTGELRVDPSATRPYRFALAIADADGAALVKLLAPTLSRDGGFLSRTLRLGSPSKPPGWLDARKAEGTIAIESLSLGDALVRGVAARVQWDGPLIALKGLKASIDGGVLSGDATADLAGRLPQLHFEGKLDEYPWHGGSVNLDGTVDAGGDVRDFLASIHAEGALKARSVTLAPDADFRTASGNFELQGFGASAKWKLSNLEASLAGDSLTGTGSTQDGKLQLDLVGKGKLVRYSSLLMAPQP